VCQEFCINHNSAIQCIWLTSLQSICIIANILFSNYALKTSLLQNTVNRQFEQFILHILIEKLSCSSSPFVPLIKTLNRVGCINKSSYLLKIFEIRYHLGQIVKPGYRSQCLFQYPPMYISIIFEHIFKFYGFFAIFFFFKKPWLRPH